MLVNVHEGAHVCLFMGCACVHVEVRDNLGYCSWGMVIPFF